MKVSFFVQANGVEVNQDELVNSVKECWKSQGKMVKDIENIELYFVAEEGKCYYVINGETKGSL